MNKAGSLSLSFDRLAVFWNGWNKSDCTVWRYARMKKHFTRDLFITICLYYILLFMQCAWCTYVLPSSISFDQIVYYKIKLKKKCFNPVSIAIDAFASLLLRYQLDLFEIQRTSSFITFYRNQIIKQQPFFLMQFCFCMLYDSRANWLKIFHIVWRRRTQVRFIIFIC